MMYKEVLGILVCIFVGLMIIGMLLLLIAGAVALYEYIDIETNILEKWQDRGRTEISTREEDK